MDFLMHVNTIGGYLKRWHDARRRRKWIADADV